MKFNKICPDKNVNKVRQNFRSKLQTVYEQFMKTRKEVNNQETQTEPIENSLKRGLAELKENENRITSSKVIKLNIILSFFINIIN